MAAGACGYFHHKLEDLKRLLLRMSKVLSIAMVLLLLALTGTVRALRHRLDALSGFTTTLRLALEAPS